MSYRYQTPLKTLPQGPQTDQAESKDLPVLGRSLKTRNHRKQTTVIPGQQKITHYIHTLPDRDLQASSKMTDEASEGLWNKPDFDPGGT